MLFVGISAIAIAIANNPTVAIIFILLLGILLSFMLLRKNQTF